MAQETPRSLQILEKLAEETPKENVQAHSYVSALRTELATEAKKLAEKEEQLAEYEQAYEKLTSPANRIGLFLGWVEEDEKKALLTLGETEYVALVDPKAPVEGLVTGARVTLNEAYAVVGVLPPHPGGAVLKVAEVLQDDRLRLGSDPANTQGRLVLRSETLKESVIKVGDEVRVEPNGRVAVEHFIQKEVQDYFVEEVPETPWEKIGGQEDAIQLIRDTIEQPMLYPEIYEKFDKKPVKGILLFGPPGCGKTLIGKAVAYNLAREYSKRLGRDVKEYFMHISGPKILNMWLGETERMVREIFTTARERAKEGRLVVVFIDEAESVLRTRSSGRWLNISNTVVPQFCAEMDGMLSLDNVVVILTSNRPDYIDPAILRPERIDRKVKVRRPDRESCKAIFNIYLHEGLPMDPELLEQFDGEAACARKQLLEGAMATLWRKTKETEFLKVFLRNGGTETLYWKDLVSGALIKSVVDRAKDYAIRRTIAEPKEQQGLSLADFKQALETEYRENEIFPKSDTLEDWLKLLDLEPEHVASVKPIKATEGFDRSRKSVI